ncbi:DUF6488 family protein [Leptospira idonii]|uniref:Uncharacterized protein n=1 Tax=Leptospira idonii TaxID=1193500 RepID=A0A4R9LVW3_9LEPT|nr:DUF6488 family protein [Leptospira idonii]TGN16937.1 hypothetical protein EHS15_18785 [Leptospira idonii]
MKNNLTKWLLTLALMGSVFGSGTFAHDHSSHKKLSKSEILASASKGVSALIAKKEKVDGSRLDVSWEDKSVTSDAIEKEGEGYYIVKFTNAKLAKSLFLLISASGDIYDANFTGVFKNLKD